MIARVPFCCARCSAGHHKQKCPATAWSVRIRKFTYVFLDSTFVHYRGKKVPRVQVYSRLSEAAAKIREARRILVSDVRAVGKESAELREGSEITSFCLIFAEFLCSFLSS